MFLFLVRFFGVETLPGAAGTLEEAFLLTAAGHKCLFAPSGRGLAGFLLLDWLARNGASIFELPSISRLGLLKIRCLKTASRDKLQLERRAIQSLWCRGLPDP